MSREGVCAGRECGKRGEVVQWREQTKTVFMVHILEAWWLPGCRYVVTAMELDVGLVVTVLFIKLRSFQV